MKRSIKSIFVFMTVVALSASLSAQTLHSSYFMTEMTGRHRLNPALKTSNNYVGFPFLNNSYWGVRSNFGMGTFLYPQEDKYVTFLHESIPADKFLNKLANNNMFEFDMGFDIINFGFWAWGGQNTFDLSLRGGAEFYMPKDLFKFLKTGQEATGVTQYNMGNMSMSTDNYLELSLGHSRDINKRLSIGATLKVLAGIAYGEMKIDQMDVSMSQNEWRIKENAHMMMSPMFKSYPDPETGEFSIENLEFSDNFPIPPGWGLGLDLGATYKLLDNLTLSAAVTDIGFMSWKDMTYAESDPNYEFVYQGFETIGDEEEATALEDELSNLFKFYGKDSKTVTRSLRSTLRVGAEYSILKDKISFGALSTTRFIGDKVYAEGMATVNFRPCSIFHITLNGSYSSVGYSFGGVINLCAPYFNLFIGTDFLAGMYSKEFIPIDSANLNASIGLSFTFGKKH